MGTTKVKTNKLKEKIENISIELIITVALIISTIMIFVNILGMIYYTHMKSFDDKALEIVNAIEKHEKLVNEEYYEKEQEISTDHFYKGFEKQKNLHKCDKEVTIDNIKYKSLKQTNSDIFGFSNTQYYYYPESYDISSLIKNDKTHIVWLRQIDEKYSESGDQYNIYEIVSAYESTKLSDNMHSLKIIIIILGIIKYTIIYILSVVMLLNYNKNIKSINVIHY